MRLTGPEQRPSPISDVDVETRARAAQELSLWDFIDPLLSSWAVIAGITLLGAAVAFFVASLQTPIYEATAVVRIASDQAVNMRMLFENRTIAGELIGEFGITTEPAWKFLSRSSPLAVDTFHLDHVSVEPVAGTNMLRVSVRLGNPELAAKVANALVERGNALNGRVNQQEVIAARDDIAAQLDEARGRLEAARADFLSFKQKSQVDRRRADANSALDANTRLLELQTVIEYERAYADLSEKHEAARLRAVSRAAPLQLVDPAVAPSSRLSPRVSTTTQLGGLLGFLLGCFLILARQFFTHRRLA